MTKRIVIVITIALSFLSVGLVSISCSSNEYSGKIETITLAVPPLEQNALLYIAESRNLFSRHNLNVLVKNFDSGVSSINAMLNGEADIAEAAEFPFVRAALQNKSARIIACNDRFENDYIIGRKDRGIETIPDLKGKRIGVTLKTINEFYLGRFLNLNSLGRQDVTIVDLTPAQFVAAVTGGDVDAVVAWQPYINQIQEKLSEYVLWPAQNSQAVYGILVSRDEWIQKHAGTVERFLRSLKEAEDYLTQHPDESRTIVQNKLNYSEKYIDDIWTQHQVFLSLDFSLIVAMNDEARWMINNGLITEQAVPDFKDYIYFEGMNKIKPEAVNIIR